MAQLDRLLAYIDEVIICIDAEGTITFASGAVARLSGYDPTSLVGRSIADFVHPEDLDEVIRLMAAWQDRQGSGEIDPLRLRVSSGEWLLVGVDAVTGIELDGVNVVVATLRLQNPASEVEHELRQRLVEQGRLVRIASSFVHLPAGQLDDGVEAALAELGGLDAVDRIEVVLFDEAERTMVNTHEWTGRDVPALRQPGRALPAGRLPFLQMLRQNHEVNIPSVALLDETWAAERAWFEVRGVRSALAVPLADRGRVIGFMGFEAVQQDWTFEMGHVLSLRSAAGILGQAFAKQAAEARLVFEARHDSLTGLPNRWAFIEALDRAVSSLVGASTAEEEGRTSVAVLLFDLDRFKVINDSLGHRLGDELLAELTRQVDAARPETTVLARMGGDELVVMVEGVTSSTEAVALAQHLLGALRRPVTVEGHEVSTTASVGIALTSDPFDSADDLLRHADAAMYAAKEMGRDRVEVFDEALRAKVRRRLQNEIELRQALDHDELTVHYQPEVDVQSDGGIIAVEALVRWRHPRRGLLAAAEFIDLAEETGIIVDIGRWVLREACAQQVRWREQIPDHPVRLRVNLSALQLAEPDLLPDVMDILSDTGIEPASLCLEITETVVMADAEASLQVLQKLRGLGVELAIDDFGTGYSSLSYLKQLPVDVLKIDRSFVDGLGTDPDDAAIIEAILVLAQSLGLGVTAEGVETETQLQELVRLGCRRVQGFFFARPSPPEEIAARLLAALHSR
jgi:diguanylate cyclase (GGDEF)-like protein/PAS domain S-box-containing protein